MNQEQWTTVDDYFNGLLVKPDQALEKSLRLSDAAGLPPHNVAPNQGKFLQLVAQIRGAKNILEIGTLGGYSTIWLARALPSDGRLVTLEANPLHSEIAMKNIDEAGLGNLVEIRTGAALDLLKQLVSEQHEHFDLIFIDADKPNNPNYLEWALKLSKKGSIIIGDNVVRNGEVANAESHDPNVNGVRSFIEMMSRDPRIDATAIQTVGCKGYDGFTIAIVNS
ncbi:MAG TPA: O-methyltransferase [Oligoflexus sp.]|uniref:O-methyltransferase n=1 Tax=Oligoflexus sp. TaxID=1971216 RepID=UPI002D41896E|nr:O-methyltransferase [Oligoflexus sp.]HYX33263.1 O-methyltransferase [Oligoflexus sp.]